MRHKKVITCLSVLLVSASVFALFSPFTLPSSPKLVYYKTHPIFSTSGSYWINFTFVSVLGQKYTSIDTQFIVMGNTVIPTKVPILGSTPLATLGSPTFYATYFYNMSCLYESFLNTNGSYSHFNYNNTKTKVCGSYQLLYTPPHPPNSRYQIIESYGIPGFAGDGYWAVSTRQAYPNSVPKDVAGWSWWYSVSDLVIVYPNSQNVSLPNVGYVVNMTTVRAPGGWTLIPSVGISGGSYTVGNTSEGLNFIVHTGVLLPLYTFRYFSAGVALLCAVTITVLVTTGRRRKGVKTPPTPNTKPDSVPSTS
ncbi:MAG: hypothetical protein QW514_10325 [Thermoprotei archaeon]